MLSFGSKTTSYAANKVYDGTVVCGVSTAIERTINQIALISAGKIV